MELFMKEPTVHESFSFMLLERIENLEKENEALRENIKEFKDQIEYYQNYHYFKFEKTFKCNHMYEIRSNIRNLLNTIMAKRSIFKPIFAVWGYDIVDVYDIYPENIEIDMTIERYYVRFTMYLRNERSQSIINMKTFLNDSTINISHISGGLYQLKFIIKEWISYQVLLPYMNENNRIEIWTKGGLLFDHVLNPNMTEDLFTNSSNYKESTNLQEEYFRLIQLNSWNELFGIVDYI